MSTLTPPPRLATPPSNYELSKKPLRDFLGLITRVNPPNGSIAGALKTVAEQFLKNNWTTNFQDPEAAKAVAKLAFKALIEEYENALKDYAQAVQDQPKAPSTGKMAYFELRPIPTNVNNFIFVMLVLNYFLQNETANTTGRAICEAIDNFFKKYTDYLPEADVFDDVFGKPNDYRAKQIQRLKEKQINLKNDVVNYLIQGIKKITPKVVNELRKVGNQLKQMIRTPRELQHLTYRQVEVLLKKDLGLLNGDVNGDGDVDVDEETQKLRDTWEKIQNKELFKKLRTQYNDIYTELEQLGSVLAQKWDTLWSKYRKGKANEDFCEKLKELIKQYSDLLTSIYVHGRIKDVFPELQIDMRAYEKFTGKRLRLLAEQQKMQPEIERLQRATLCRTHNTRAECAQYSDQCEWTGFDCIRKVAQPTYAPLPPP